MLNITYWQCDCIIRYLCSLVQEILIKNNTIKPKRNEEERLDLIESNLNWIIKKLSLVKKPEKENAKNPKQIEMK